MPTSEGSNTSLQAHGILTVVVFAIVMIIVIQPVKVPVPFAISRWVARRWHRLGSRMRDGGPPDPPADDFLGMSTRNGGTDTERRSYLVLNHVSAPIIGILLLLATQSIGGEQIRLGIVGQEGVEPYDALLLFLGLAYMAISLDATGLLRYLALHVSIKGGRSGPRLFNSLYGFFFLLGLLVGNDAVILSGTSFLAHFTRVAGLSRPDAWIWAQFAAANIASATLVSSNLTNVVIASGFGLKFTTFSAFMALPTLASGLAALFTIRLTFINRREHRRTTTLWPFHERRRPVQRSAAASAVGSGNPEHPHTEFGEAGAEARSQRGDLARRQSTAAASDEIRKARRESDDVAGSTGRSSSDEDGAEASRQVVFIPAHLIAPDVRPRTVLLDPFGAVFGSVVMAATLVALVATSVSGGVKVYQVAVPGACICLLRDLFKDLRDLRRQRADKLERQNQASPCTDCGPRYELEVLPPNSAVESRALATEPPKKTVSQQMPSRHGLLRYIQLLTRLCSQVRTSLPTLSHVVARLPLPLIPFAFGMFILDEGLAHVGFIRIMAQGLGKVCASGGEIGTAFFIGFLCVVLCCFGGTNIGASILLVRSILDAGFQSRLPLEQRASITRIALYSLGLGSNVGALGGTFAASLAGLLWRSSLRHAGITVRPSQFFAWSMLTMPLSLGVGLVVVWAQEKSGKWPV
ncbi:unnamed protein product [Parajaminaea phylloscopi]